MTNCHVSEKWKSWPLIPHPPTTPAAKRKVEARPAASEVLLAKSPKNFETGDGSCLIILASTTDQCCLGAKSSAFGNDGHTFAAYHDMLSRALPKAGIESDRRVRPSR